MHQMETYFDGLSWHEISADTSGVISDMMDILRKNQASRPRLAAAPCAGFDCTAPTRAGSAAGATLHHVAL